MAQPEKKAMEFSGVSEQKYVLMDILVQSFTDKETRETIPYYEIWVKNVSTNKIIKFKPADYATFSDKISGYLKLAGKEVRLVITAKLSKGAMIAVVEDILPIL